ncbi:MAG: MFS transporter [Proteobacteria bacterium]|nr:MFS transporter [Pseudomonadota bacterium]
MEKKQSNYSLIFITWVLLVLFYGYQYFLRVAPSVMAHDLRCEFSLNAEQFAFIPAIYLYAYGLLQIPIGLFLDSIGVKRTMMISIFICFLGTLLFFTAPNIQIAYFARFLIGAGSAAAFITPLKIVGDNMPEGKKGFYMGLTLTFGTIGALIAGKPQSLLMEHYGWRDTGLISAIGGLILFLCVVFFIPRKGVIDEHTKKVDAFENITSQLKKIINNKLIFIYAFLAFGLYTPLAVLSDTWGVTYFMEKLCITREVAAECTAFIFIGLCIGSFVIPNFFEKRNRINQGIQIGLVCTCLTFLTILYGNFESLYVLKIFLFLFGFFAGAEMLCFTGVSNNAQDGIRGLALGFANTVNMVGGAILQQVIGLLLDKMWSGKISEKGIRIYLASDFEKTFIFYIAIYIFCIFLARYVINTPKKL